MHVRVGQDLAAQIAAEFESERSPSGASSEYDFWAGPLAAALLGFRDFVSLPFDEVPQVRRLTVLDPALGPVVFIGVQLESDLVEIAGYGRDPDYWDAIERDPDE
jgi:hypothetical protein